MTRKEAVSFDDIKRGFSAADPKRTKRGKTVDFKVRKVEESQTKFGNEALCQSEIWNSTGA